MFSILNIGESKSNLFKIINLIKPIIFSFKVEYQCNKQTCDDCDAIEECKCNGLKSILFSEKTCVLCQTSDGFYIDGKFCKKCFQGCSSCKSSQENDCISCFNGYFFQDNKCLQCNSVCETCNGPNSNQCLKCKLSKLILTENKECSDNCKQNEFNDGISCFVCHNQCTACKNENYCTACSKGYFLRGRLCVEKCGTNEFINEKNECKLCDQSCKTCSGSSDIDCTSCANNDHYIHQENNKCSKCDIQNGYFISESKCLKCFLGCLTCFGSAQGMCKSCKSSFYFDKVYQTCNQCHPECNECSGIKQNQCINCKQPDKYISLQDNICQFCNKNEYNDGKRCQLCSKECLTCLKYDQCTSCADNLYLRVQEQKCVLQKNDNEFTNEKKQRNDTDKFSQQKSFEEIIEIGVKYVNQAAGILQFALIFTSVNSPMFWYWAQSYQHMGNYDIYENEFNSYGLGPVYLRSFYKSYNIFPNLPQIKLFKQNEKNQVVNLLKNKNLTTNRLLLKKQDLNWDSGTQQSLFNNLIYWSFMMIFIFLIFILMKFIHQKNIIIYNIYIKKEEYIIRFIFFTSNYILMQMSLALEGYKWINKDITENIMGLFISFFFIACYLYSLFRLYKQANSKVQEKQEFVSIFDRYLIKQRRRYKYFWILFEIRKTLVVIAFCFSKYFLISSITVLSLDVFFLLYLVLYNPFTDKYISITFIFQEVSKVIIDILLLLCYELAEFKNSICFSVVIILMMLNFISLVFVVILIIIKILEYFKNRKHLKADLVIQELSFINYTDLIQGQTKRPNLSYFEKNSYLYSKPNIIDNSGISISLFNVENIKNLKQKNEKTNNSYYTKYL